MIRYMLLAALLAAIVILVGASPPQDAVEAHRYADSVLHPAFTAAFNAFTYEHPKDPEGRQGEHCRKIDAGDAKRWEQVEASFEKLKKAMRQAGYK